MFKLFLILFYFNIFNTAICSKILGIFHIPGHSHFAAGSTLMKILARNGHEVTIISPFEEKDPPLNYKQVHLPGIYDDLLSSNHNTFDLTGKSPISDAIIFSHVTTSMIENTFKHPEFQKFIKSNVTFDAVIIEAFQSEAMQYLAYHFNAHCIVFSSVDSNKWVNQIGGNPDPPSFIPAFDVPFSSEEMKFFQRLYNSLIYILQNLIVNFYTLPVQDQLVHKYFPKAPALSDIIYNVSLVFLNTDLGINEAKPKVPSFIDIGGFHVQKPKPLPNDLQNILNRAKHGVIYFSMGSTLRGKDISLKTRNLLMKAFSNLNQTVLWKFEDGNIVGKPDNVIIEKWFPQNDLLASGKISLFISHGGLFSIMESIFHGVPFLGVPVTAEQTSNVRKAARSGYAKFVPYSELTEERLIVHIEEMLNNSKYKENIQKRSRIMKDKPIPPADSINYWVEYVIRHKGAAHLRVASLNLAWYQYLLLDVTAFILGVTLSVVFTIKMIFKIVFGTRKSEAFIDNKKTE